LAQVGYFFVFENQSKMRKECVGSRMLTADRISPSVSHIYTETKTKYESVEFRQHNNDE